MSVVFLANIGNSDLVVEGVGRKELPREARPLAERLMADRETYWARVRLPILTKALDYVLAQEGAIDAVILFVSDQDRLLAGVEGWSKDTCELGRLAAEKLKEQYQEQGWGKRQVRLHTVRGNPADYDTMLHYFDTELPGISSHYEGAGLRVYLSLTGGTPAMNAMLLVAGNEVFGLQTVNLYDAKERKQPFPLGVGRRLACRPLRVALRTNLEAYQYSAALALVETEGGVVVDSGRSLRVLGAVLKHARDRLAFNFSDAAQALDDVLTDVAGPQKDHLLFWQNQVIEPSEADRLRELYFSGEIKRKNHAFAGWLERVFRFQESALRYAAVCHGVSFRDTRRQYVDPGWIDAQPGLRAHLAQAPRPGGGAGLDPRRPASRPLLGAILSYVADRDGDETLRSLLVLSHQLEGLASLRNNWVHRSQGVRLEDLEAAFGGAVQDAAGALAGMFCLLTGDEVGDNLYDAINRFCLELAGGS